MLDKIKLSAVHRRKLINDERTLRFLKIRKRYYQVGIRSGARQFLLPSEILLEVGAVESTTV